MDGERASRTQPQPVKPAPFARQRLTEDMLTRRTPAAHAAVLEAFRRFRSDGQFVPLDVGVETVVFPGFDGGGGWGGPAFDPATGLLYVSATEMACTGMLAPAVTGSSGRQLYVKECAACHRDDMSGSPPQIPSLVDVGRRKPPAELTRIVRQGVGRMAGLPALSPEAVDAIVAFIGTGENRDVEHAGATSGGQRYRFTGYKRFLDPDGYPAIEPPWGTLTAIDLNTGEHAWQIPLGEYPELAAQGLKNTGTRALRRPDRDRRRPGVHRRDQLRQEGAGLRQDDGRAAVGGDAAVLGRRHARHLRSRRPPVPGRARRGRQGAASRAVGWRLRRVRLAGGPVNQSVPRS